jgi:hypothetical protein
MDGDPTAFDAVMGLCPQLNQFDSFLLSNVLDWLGGYDIAMLWYTGDQKMRYLMSHGRAVTRFVTTFENYEFPLHVAYPRLIDSFEGLQTLKMSTHMRLDLNIPDFSPSSSLRSLEIPNLCSGFHNLLRTTSDPFPSLVNLKLSINQDWLVDLKRLPATLETLRIGALRHLRHATFLLVDRFRCLG